MLSPYRLFIATFLMTLTCTSLAALAQAPERAIIPVSCTRGPSGCLLVECTFNGKTKALFQIDTGMSDSRITDSLAKRLGLEMKPTVDSEGHSVTDLQSRAKQARMVNVEKLVVGNSWLISDAPFLVMPSKFFEKVGQNQIEGIIGMNFFFGSSVLIDFVYNRLVLWYPSKATDEELKQAGLADAVELPLLPGKEDACVTATFPGGVTEDVLIDTGATQSVFSQDAAKRLTLVPMDQSDMRAFSFYGKLRVLKSKPMKISLGSLQIDHFTPYYVEKGQPGLPFTALGMDVLGDCLLYIDIPGKRLLIKKPPRVNVGGMGVAWTQLARVVVIYVEEGSSAQAAGVKVGDEVMEINDKLSRDLMPEKLTAELKAVGKGDMTVKILPSGKAEPRTVILKL